MGNENNSDTAKSDKVKEKRKFIVLGPGIILAATGIGSGDLVTNSTAGANFGIVLAWAIIIGVSFKILVTEGVGRYTLATGKTIIEGWRSLGKWTMYYFVVYVTLFGLFYGAAIATACGIMMYTMFPIIPWWAWAIIHAVVGFVLMFIGRYKLFERIITILIGVMFVTIVGSALMLIPNLADLPSEALTLGIPEGSTFMIMSIIGGIGGTMALAAYSYWINEKGWDDYSYIPTMRADVITAYVVTAIFSISLMIVSTALLYGDEVVFEGAEGMRTFINLYGDNFGEIPQLVLNIGFWCATFSSLLGLWNGIPYLFADFIKVMKQKTTNHRQSPQPLKKTPAYRFYLGWLTFPPMLLLMIDNPLALVLLYAALGSLFIPFVALTLLILLNSKQVKKEYKNKFYHNALLVFVLVVFVVLGILEFL